MKKTTNWWFAVLLAALLVGILVGIASADPNDSPQGAKVRTLTLSAADCYPWTDDTDYVNGGYYLRGMTGAVNFMCPVRFPGYGRHRVQAITLYAYDRHESYDVCAEARLTDPSRASERPMGIVCSTGYSQTDPRSFTTSGDQISPNLVDARHAMYLWLAMEGTPDLFAYGFHVDYQ